MSKEITVYYATETGNSEDLANRTEEKLKELGYMVTVTNLSDTTPAALEDGGQAIFIVSTWGDGEPPYAAEDFANALFEGSFSMNKLSYAVLALGDSSYDDFCGFGRKLDEALKGFGANMLMDRKELDFDFESDYQAWLESVAVILG